MRIGEHSRRYRTQLAALCLVSLVAVPQVWAQSRPVTPRQLLGQAIDLYMEGRYKEAAERLRPLVQTRVLKDRADQKEALRAYGVSLYLSGAKAGAERAFRDLLRLDRAEKLDPEYVRPEVIVFFEYVRNKYQAELTTVVRKAPKVWVNMIPPWGQFQNGHRTKGYLLLGGEIAFGVTSITTFALLASWNDETGEYKGHEDDYDIVKPINIVAFSITAALVIYGVVDGLYYYYKTPFRARAAKVGAMDHMSGPAQPPALIRF